MAAPSREAVEHAVEELRTLVSGKIEVDVPISPFTSFRLGGPAAILAEARDEQDLIGIGSVVRARGIPPLVLGRGTNVLVSDHGFPGIVVRLGKGFEWIRGEGDRVEAGGMTPLPQVANWAARRSLQGLEFAVAIPATVGGAVRMNAGAHDSSVAGVLASAAVYGLSDGERRSLTPEELRMGYRETALRGSDVVCSASFALASGDRGEIAARMERYRLHRSETQPAEAPNAGSMFRNPSASSAGLLIEAARLKGFRIGGAEVSGKHANFFLAHPGATAQDVYDLMAEVQRIVLERSGVLLIPEVATVGRFDESTPLRRGR